MAFDPSILKRTYTVTETSLGFFPMTMARIIALFSVSLSTGYYLNY